MHKMTELYSQVTMHKMVSHIVTILQLVNEKYSGVCVGKFAYDVLSCLNTNNYSNISKVQHYMNIQFPNDTILADFLTKDINIKSDDYSIEILCGISEYPKRSNINNTLFVNYLCHFDVESMMVVHDTWSTSEFLNILNNEMFRNLTKYGYIIFIDGELPGEYLHYKLLFKGRLVNNYIYDDKGKGKDKDYIINDGKSRDYSKIKNYKDNSKSIDGKDDNYYENDCMNRDYIVDPTPHTIYVNCPSITGNKLYNTFKHKPLVKPYYSPSNAPISCKHIPKPQVTSLNDILSKYNISSSRLSNLDELAKLLQLIVCCKDMDDKIKILDDDSIRKWHKICDKLIGIAAISFSDIN